MSGIAIPLCVIPVSLRHIVSDPRPQVADNLGEKNENLLL